MEEKKIEEALEQIWMKLEQGEGSLKVLLDSKMEELQMVHLEELVELDYISLREDEVILEAKGKKIASRIIRGHRLAERLFTDVLELKASILEPSACSFEHVISPEVAEAICTLLGHPLECPHGWPIPPGNCCLRAEKEVERVILPLSELRSGSEGKIAYISTRHHHRLDKLTSLGILPGVRIRVHQTFPSFIVQVAQTQIALDKDILKDIYVRKSL